MKTADTVYGLFVIVFVLWAGISLGLHPPKFECEKYRTIVSVDTVDTSNIWGKEVIFVENFDDGSKRRTGYSGAIGDTECSHY